MKKLLLISISLISSNCFAQDFIKSNEIVTGFFSFRGYMKPNEIIFTIRDYKDSIIYYNIYPLRTNLDRDIASLYIDPVYKDLMLQNGRKLSDRERPKKSIQ